MSTDRLVTSWEVGDAPDGASPSTALVREYLPDITKIVFSIALVFGTAEIFRGNPYLGLIDLVLACWLLLMMLNMKAVQRLRFAGEMLLLPALFILVSSAYLTPDPGYIWSFPGAAAIFLLTDKRAGVVIAMVFATLILASIRGAVDDAILVRVGVNLAAVSAICFFFRHRLELSITRNTIQQNLLEEARQAQASFIDSVSHEMRTPLTAIKGFAEVLSLSGTNAEEQPELLEKIRLNATYLNFQISEIIDCSRLRGQEIACTPEPASIDALTASVFKDIVDIQRLFGTGSTVALKNIKAGTMPPSVLLDIDHVRITLARLLVQAIQGTEEGYVELRTEYDADAEHVTFTIRDTGTDITHEATGSLRTALTLSRGKQGGPLRGIGLGLLVSQQIAKAMGGKISLQPGDPGNIVTLRLPAPCTGDCKPALDEPAPDSGSYVRPDQSRVDKPPHLARVSERRAPRILITDDSETNRMLMSLLLQDLGYETAEAADGEEALDAFDPQNYDAILMDIQMPGMSGIEATRELRSRGVNVPIFAISAGTALLDAAESEKGLFDGILSKPIDRELFLTLMKQCQLAAPKS